MPYSHMVFFPAVVCVVFFREMEQFKILFHTSVFSSFLWPHHILSGSSKLTTISSKTLESLKKFYAPFFIMKLMCSLIFPDCRQAPSVFWSRCFGCSLLDGYRTERKKAWKHWNYSSPCLISNICLYPFWSITLYIHVLI